MQRNGCFLTMICAESNHLRISFSGDLSLSDITPVEHTEIRRDTTLLDSNSDFEFHTCRSFEHDSSPADEIFANGMILPVLPFQFQEKVSAPKRLYTYKLPPIVSVQSPPPPRLSPPRFKLTENSRKDVGSANSDSEAEKASKSFWSFKRSSSLNCDIKKSLICPFARLNRSNSTGSVTNSKRAMLKDGYRHSSQRHASQGRGLNPSSPSSSSSPSSLCCNVYQFRQQKHSGKRNSSGGGGGNGSLRMNQALNVPPPFGLGSILRNSKDKKKKN